MKNENKKKILIPTDSGLVVCEIVEIDESEEDETDEGGEE